MTTPNIDLNVLMPVTYTGKFNSDGGRGVFRIKREDVFRVPVPFTGQVMVQIVSGSKSPFYGYAHGGGYTFANLVESTGSPQNWRCVYNVVVGKAGSVEAYPYISRPADEDADAPVSITFFPMGEHKN